MLLKRKYIKKKETESLNLAGLEKKQKPTNVCLSWLGQAIHIKL